MNEVSARVGWLDWGTEVEHGFLGWAKYGQALRSHEQKGFFVWSWWRQGREKSFIKLARKKWNKLRSTGQAV